MLKYFQAGYYLPFLVTVWGLISLCIGFVNSYKGLLIVRFFLGLAEGGLLGGMIIYLAMFYRRHQMLYRIGLFYCAAPLSGAMGGLLATGLAKIKTPGYNGWPFIFFVEGVSIVLDVSWALLTLIRSNHSGIRHLNIILHATHAIACQIFDPKRKNHGTPPTKT